MKFRPCIDIHNGQVKQIIGGSLRDEADQAKENFVATKDASYYAKMYQKNHLSGGHIILLNASDSPFYEATKKQAVDALTAFPKGMQIGGGINDKNADFFLDKGASHVIVTSFVFKDGRISCENLEKINKAVGKENLVLDLSCKRKEDGYYIVTDRWQKDTDTKINFKTLDFFEQYCDEFLIHAVDVEGKMQGIETELVKMLGQWGKIPVTYAGGVHAVRDLNLLREQGSNKLDVTIGSALDIFGGTLSFEKMVEYLKH